MTDKINTQMLEKVESHLESKHGLNPLSIEMRVAYLIYYAIYSSNFKSETVKTIVEKAYDLYIEHEHRYETTLVAFQRSIYRAIKSMFPDKTVNIKRIVNDIAFNEILG